jgi:hypothetical protein
LTECSAFKDGKALRRMKATKLKVIIVNKK